MNDELKKRIPTAIVYVLVIVGCLLGGWISTLVLITVLFAFCTFEFLSHSAINSSSSFPRLPSVLLILLYALSFFVNADHDGMTYILWIAVVFLILNGIYLLLKGQNTFEKWPLLLSSFFYLGVPFGISVAMTMTHNGYPIFILFLFILIWLNDAGAYFVGKAFGSNKMHPKISPNKTWEGFFGGGLMTLIAAFAISHFHPTITLTTWFTIGLAVWVFSVVGDLVESSWKRNKKIKDTGTILPGHGGFLDRLDSFIYTAPLLAMIVHYLR